MSNPSEEKPIPVVGNVAAPDVFADGVVGAFLTNGNVHITFSARRCDYGASPPAFSDVVIGRLVMPFGATEGMVRFLTECLARMKKQVSSQGADSQRTLQ